MVRRVGLKGRKPDSFEAGEQLLQPVVVRDNGTVTLSLLG